MERLTVKRTDGRWALAKNDGESPSDQINKIPLAIERLAAYEDTEMEPEEIVSVQEEPWCVFYANRHCNLDGDFCQGKSECQIKLSTENAVRLLKISQAERNQPLIFDELKEMDGQPVWVTWAGHSSEGWALVRVWSKADNIIYLTYHNGASDSLRFLLDNGAKIYRNRPEKRV